MGRIFEVRKHSMFARYDRMAKQFTRIGKEIAIAVKSGGPDPDSNPALRRVMQNAKGVNMPKDKVEAAIKRAMGRDISDYEEVLYEGYAPHGVAILIETATDNITRTVANVRAIFNKYNGSLSTSGSVSFQFKKMGVFKLDPSGLDPEELELELIDHGLEEMGEGTGENDEELLVIRVPFVEFGNMQHALEEKGLKVISSELEWIPLNLVKLGEEEEQEVLKLIGKMEEDEDVQKVFYNLE
ncbi:MAG: YebC/PmpR family DNA-binding transcriptional regulator [Lewinellaceae bacterium]|nr:YebC/PmpR family DNA-binding transcriptional regulator [Saprospiraceae bacterium]MCB9269766.1 YebC/PmpR family DNA-binding transcriptional regulator [Lewinellaceae bacterium]HPG06649.1 YebC/PmpR family DNA-binding transcriptional regulator [Saprospiraceae bacterium]HPQ99087.1 YebC/PmpR family DNA-binding transcriptional regulator [Saprospiraceae bacterium]HQU53743.1 YebC/PmpR family DNA-binding transcriptional regulator [Saprospiraceae bacterium]